MDAGAGDTPTPIELAPHRRRRLIEWAVGAAVLAAIFGPALTTHVRHASDPWRFNDDARQQIWPFFKYGDPTLFGDDYLAVGRLR